MTFYLRSCFYPISFITFILYCLALIFAALVKNNTCKSKLSFSYSITLHVYLLVTITFYPDNSFISGSFDMYSLSFGKLTLFSFYSCSFSFFMAFILSKSLLLFFFYFFQLASNIGFKPYISALNLLPVYIKFIWSLFWFYFHFYIFIQFCRGWSTLLTTPKIYSFLWFIIYLFFIFFLLGSFSVILLYCNKTAHKINSLHILYTL